MAYASGGEGPLAASRPKANQRSGVSIANGGWLAWLYRNGICVIFLGWRRNSMTIVWRISWLARSGGAKPENESAAIS